MFYYVNKFYNVLLKYCCCCCYENIEDEVNSELKKNDDYIEEMTLDEDTQQVDINNSEWNII